MFHNVCDQIFKVFSAYFRHLYKFKCHIFIIRAYYFKFLMHIFNNLSKIKYFGKYFLRIKVNDYLNKL